MSYIDNLSDRDLTKSMLASLRRAENKKSAVTFQLEADDVLTEQLMAILAAIEALRDAVVAMPAPVVNVPPAPEIPAPVVNLASTDLTDIVTAVTSLNGTGPTAEEIAGAIAAVIAPAPAASPDGTEALAAVAKALEKLDFRLKGVGAQAYGGGAVSFSDSGYRQLAEAVQTTTTTTVVAAVAASVTAVELGTNRATRSSMTIFNEPGASTLYLKFGAGASLASYSNRLQPGDYWEASPPKYTGPVTGIWDGTTGQALITEFLS